VTLTAIEFRMSRCFLLAAAPGQVLSKAVLIGHVYEGTHDADSNVIEVFVNRLRSKLGRELIATRRGQGYVLGDRRRVWGLTCARYADSCCARSP
jgi:two-component system OmpR family response regulator